MIISKKKKSQLSSLMCSKLSNYSPEPQINIEDKIIEMQKKLSKIMNAYIKLQKTCKQKDIKIEQLLEQNKLLKVQIYDNQLQQESTNYHHQAKPIKALNFSNRTNNFYNQSISSINQTQSNFNQKNISIRQYKSVSPITKFNSNDFNKNNQEKERIVKTNFNTNKFNDNSLNFKGVQAELPSKFNCLKTSTQTEEDLQFCETLQKLKEKINKYELEEQREEKQIKDKPQNEEITMNIRKNQNKTLKQVKSTENITKVYAKNSLNPLSKIESNKNIQRSAKNQDLSKLKNIWNQRDREIKKMDDLFANIDKRINAERG